MNFYQNIKHELIKNENNKDKITEKISQDLILEDLPSFLKELGKGFSFIKKRIEQKKNKKYKSRKNIGDNNI